MVVGVCFFKKMMTSIVYKMKDKIINEDATTIQGKDTWGGMSIQIICNAIIKYNTAVVSFPCHSAPFTICVFLNAIRRKVKEVISFTTMMESGSHIQGKSIKSAIRIIPCVNLSATGSSAFPRSVTILNFLAINPSTTSVRPDKNTNASAQIG